MVQLPVQQRYRLAGSDSDLLSFGAFVIAAGARSTWPIDADSRAVAIIVIVIAVVLRRFRTGTNQPIRTTG